MKSPLLEIRGLHVEFATRRGVLRALDDVSLSIAPGEVLGVVGESGAGKSLTGAAVIGLLDPPGRIAGGEIRLDGMRIDNLPPEEMRKVRGREIGAIFQDPLTSLNPLYSIGRQLTETILAHRNVSAGKARQQAIELLAATGIPAAESRIDHYPHQFSGGMRQRVVIALALAAEPRLVVADEPTTALDVSIQAQIIGLLKSLCRSRGTAVMLVTHDMGVIAETADRVAVMYAGRIVEDGPVGDVLNRPRHPYTAGLMGAIPTIGESRDRLLQIDGAMPRLDAMPTGCAFHPRCPRAMDVCRSSRPAVVDHGATSVACWLHHEVGGAGARAREEAEPRVAAIALNGIEPTPNGRRTASIGRSIHRAGSGSGTEAGAGSIATATAVSAVTATSSDSTVLVSVSSLSKIFDVSAPWLDRLIDGRPRQSLQAVDSISFDILRGETLALVGESGCGKSTVARMLVGLHSPSKGEIRYDAQPLASSASERSPALRRRIQMIFQDPYASLNSRWPVGRIVAEPLRVHRLASDEDEFLALAEDALRQVGLSSADLTKYPHQFSGGQRQRISIARALCASPEFLVCDEPTSALDVSVQAQVLNLMRDLQLQRGLTYLFISHNLAVVHHVADRVGVMYLGRIVELAGTSELFATPLHPYTRMLLAAIPDPKRSGRARTVVSGEVPNPLAPPRGCGFNPRCPHANDRCRTERPAVSGVGGRLVACHAVEEGRL